jgi:N-acetyl-anhydromuramyl-L-alanine amidase AmpD
LVPAAVLSRFAGNERLYYSLATFRDRDRSGLEIMRVPPEAAPSIYLSKSFSGRTRGFTTPRLGANYNGNQSGPLEWAGDSTPGASPAPLPASSGKTPIAAAKSIPFRYDDGFGDDLWATGQEADVSSVDDAHGIEGPIPDTDPAVAAQGLTYTRPLTASEYPGASRFEPANPGNYRHVTGTRTIDRIVIHITDGGSKISGTIGWFKDPKAKASSHYIVGRDGEVVQMVHHNDVAWHASSANGDSIGIEHNANSETGLLPTEAQYCASAKLVSWLCGQFNLPMDRDHVLGHSEADPHTTHTDCPNSIWDWDYYMPLVTSGACPPPKSASQSLAYGARRERNGHTRPKTKITRAQEADVSVADDNHGIEGPIPDDNAATQGLAYVRPQTASEYPSASRFEPAYSGNFRHVAGTRTISRVVVHITDGGRNINGTIGWFKDPRAQVSAHYVVGQDGEVVQMVMHNDVAWHASSANGDAIGIEHVANTRGLMPTEAEYCASAALVNWLCGQFSIPMDRVHVLGHSEADPRTSHTGCPNAVWNWDYYMGLVTSGSCYPMSSASSLAYEKKQQRAYKGNGVRVTRAQEADVSAEDDTHGIEGPIPDSDSSVAQALHYTRSLTASEYPSASRFEPANAANYRRFAGTRAINRVVIHITDGGSNINGTIAWFKDARAKASAHYVIGQDGEVVQMVMNNDVAWHAASANGDTVGIEHVANTRGLTPTKAEYCASASLVNWLCARYGIPIDRTHVLGHAEADPHTSHTACPNAVWDWDQYMGLVTGGICPAPAVAQSLRYGGALGFGAFAGTDVDRMKTEFVNNAAAGAARQNCITIMNAGLRRLYGPALLESDGSQRALSDRVNRTMDALQNYGLAGARQDFEFLNASGTLTKGVLRPERLRDSVEGWLMSQADANQMSAWYIFGLSLMDGYHSVLLALMFSGSGNPLTKLYWLDQIYGGFDDVTGSADARITDRTQKWWDGETTKPRTRATIWPLIPA